MSTYPPTCILTGAPGENPDDCATHEHENDQKHVLIVGNPIDGLTLFGPFDDHYDAAAHGEECFDGEDWWVTPIIGMATLDTDQMRGLYDPRGQKATVAERLIAIEASGWPIAYDGCHKLYFLQDADREQAALAIGYEIHPSTEIRELYGDSCGLRFVTRWGFDNTDFAHEFNIKQFEDDGVDSIITNEEFDDV